MKAVNTIFILFIFISTLAKSQKIIKDHLCKDSLEFQSYIQTLNLIPLPFIHSTQAQLPEISMSYNKGKFKKYKHKNTHYPLGVLINDEKKVVVIDIAFACCGLAPFLMSYDKKGNKLDSLGLFKKSGADMDYRGYESIIINENHTITVIDSVYTWKVNDDKTDILPETKTFTSDTIIYWINKEGIIRIK